MATLSLPKVPQGLVADLSALVSQVSAQESDRIAYARDLWPRQQIRTQGGEVAVAPPSVVVWPETVEETSEVVKFAAARGIPVVPYGAGSGVCGGVHSTPESIVVDVKRMRAVNEINPGKLRVSAQAGIIGQHLEDALLAEDLTLGHYPSSIYCSTLGGWIAGRSAGQCSGRYGKIEDMVTALTFVSGTGEIHRVNRDREPALMPLIIGSEGILGIVTEAELRITPAPKHRTFSSFTVPSTEAGLSAIRDIYQAGLRPAVCRLYDPFDTLVARRGKVKGKKNTHADGPTEPGLGMRVLRRALGKPELLNTLIHHTEPAMGGAMMILVWEDDERIGLAEAKLAKQIVLGHRGEDTGPAPAKKWIAHRHNVSYRQSPVYAAGAFVDTMEVAANWSRMMPMYNAVRKALSKHVFVMAHFSHAYPDGGSIYFSFVGSASSPEEKLRKYDAAWKDALVAVVSSGGSLSHHHGVGRSKAPLMRREQGAAIEVVYALKRLLDPANILNPGNLLPQERENHEAPHDAQSNLSWDQQSMLVRAPGALQVLEVEDFVNARGCTLGLSSIPDTTVEEWILSGGTGAHNSDNDPVFQWVAGVEGTWKNNSHMRIRPAPRRAVGPDLVAALIGSRGVLGRISSVHLATRKQAATERIVWEFGSNKRAKTCLAWIRGRGARPVQAFVRESTLAIEFEADGELGAARRELIAEEVSQLGGTKTCVWPLHEPTARSKTELLEALGAALTTK